MNALKPWVPLCWVDETGSVQQMTPHHPMYKRSAAYLTTKAIDRMLRGSTTRR